MYQFTQIINLSQPHFYLFDNDQFEEKLSHRSFENIFLSCEFYSFSFFGENVCRNKINLQFILRNCGQFLVNPGGTY